MGCVIKIGNQSVSETDFLNHLNKIININKLFEENLDFSSKIYEALGFGKESNLSEKNIFTVEPIQSVDKKAKSKAKISTQYIGFAEGIEGSSTALYAKQISEQNNKFKIPISKTLNKFLEPFFNSNDESIVEPLAKNLTNEDKQILAKSIGRSYKDINQFDWYEAIWSDAGQEEVYYYLKTGNNLEQDIQKEKVNSKLYNEWQNFIKENKDFVDGFYKLPKEIQKEQKKDFDKLKEKNDWYVFELSNLEYGIRENLLKQEGYLENKINITSNIVNSGNYSSTDVIFVSIGGKRGNEAIRKAQQDRTIREAIKAIEAGATLITDNKSYVESSDYNEGEKRLAKNLEAKGYNYSEQIIDGQVLGVWNNISPLNTIESNTLNNSLEEGLQWLNKIMPDVNPEIIKGLVNDIGNGSYNTLEDIITFSEQYANKGTVKHEAVHRILALLPKEKREGILNDASKKFNIPRGKSKTTIKYSINQQNQINYTLKSIDILNSDKAKQVFEKGKKANWDLNKILTELQIPKEQKQLLLDLGFTDREQIALELASNYSYSVEINTAKEKSSMIKEIKSVNGFSINGDIYDRVVDEDIFGVDDREIFTKNNKEISEQEYRDALFEYNNRIETPTQHYSDLTVPGGTNYTENEISTPLITPSIKGHAQFSTPNGVGWFRSDESQQYQETDIQSIIDNLQKSGQLEINCK